MVRHLQLDDWVYAESNKTQPERVVGISRSAVMLANNHKVELKDICPVSLTNEIIKKNNLDIYWHDNKTVYLIKAYNQFEMIVRCGIDVACRRVVNHVHEVQHILRIFSIDKDIELD